MKRFFKSTLLLIVAAATLVSCNWKEQPVQKGTTLTANPSELAFAAKSAGTQQIEIASDGEWIATAPEWLSIDPLTGMGDATVIVKAKDNVDASGATQGPRSGKVVFALLDDESINATVNVSQDGDQALDTRHTYVKVNQVTSGKAYLVVAQAPNQDDALVIPVLFGDTGTYGYPKSTKVEANADGSITLDDETSGLVFTAVEGGYTIQMYNSRYIWKQDGYKTWSCSLLGELPAEPYVWAVAPRADGTFEITLNNGIMSYGTENYTTFSAYPAADEYTVYPFLYEDTKDVVLNTDYLTVNPKSQTVAASATEAEFAVSSNLAWSVVKKEGDWVKNFAESGSGDGKLTVQFDANTGDNERTASFTVSSTDGAFAVDITLTQSGVVTNFDSIADVQKSTDTEKTYNVKGTVAGIYARGCLVTDGTGYILYYKNAAVDFEIGDEITLSGVISAYGGFNQFTNAAVVEKVGHNDSFAHPTATAYDNAAFQSWYDAETKTFEFVSFEGVLAVDGSYYNVTVEEGSTLIARLQYATIENAAELNGHKIAVTGYTIGSTKYNDAPIVNVMMVTIEDKGAVLEEVEHGPTTIADFIAAPVSSMDWYQLTGKITNIDNAKYNDFYMEDETGKVYVYGLYKEKGAERIFNYVDSLGLAVNDIITIVAQRSEYSGTVQAGSAYYISHEKGTEPEPELDTYTTAAAVNTAILGGATSFIFNPENWVEVTYVNGSNVFAQDATGAVLLYGTGLEAAGAYCGLRIKGALTCTAKVYNGLPEITAVKVEDLAAIQKDYNATYPCINISLADLLANYDKYLNCKVKVDGVKVADGWQGTTDRNGKIAVGTDSLNVYCQDKTDTLNVKTGCEGNIVCWPTYYKTTKQVGFWPAEYDKGKSFFTVTKEAGAGDEPQLDIYTNCLAASKAILGGATKFIFNPEEFVEVTYVNGSSVFVQDATGALLLYGTGLESAGAYGGLRIKGALTVAATLYNGVPEITAITDGLTAITKDYNAKYPCINLTLADLLAKYDDYLNCKIKISGVTVKDGWQGTTDRNGVITVGTDEVNVYCQSKSDTLQVKTGCEGNIVCFPTYYKTTKQVGFWPADYSAGKSFFTVTKAAPSEDTPPVEETIYANCGELNAAILALTAGTKLTFKANFTTNAEITYMGTDNKSIYVQDATGGLLLYNADLYTALKAQGAQPGIAVTGEMTGVAEFFNGLPEVTSIDISKAQIKQTWGFPCKTITLANLLADFNKYLNCKVKIDGVTVADGWQGTTDRNGKVSVGTDELAVYCKDKNDATEIKTGCEGNIVAWPGINNGTKQLAFWPHQEAGKCYFTVTKEAPSGDEPEEPIYTNCGELNAAIVALEGSNKLNFKANFTTNAEITLMGSDNKSIFVQDATGGLLLYNADLYTALKAQGAQAGISITGEFSGTAEKFNFQPEVTTVDISKAQIKQTWGFPCKNLTIAELTADFDKYVNCKVKIADVEVTDGWNKSDKNGVIAQTTNTLPVYVKNGDITDNVVAGSTGAFVGYPAYTKKDNAPVKQVCQWESGKFIATAIPGVITANNVSVKVGETAEIGATCNIPDATLIYESTDETVATVSAAGVVTGVKAGEIKLIISAAASGIYSAAQQTIAVVVTEGDATALVLDGEAIKAAHSAAWTYSSGEKKITAADGSEWIAYNTFANISQVTIQMNKGKSAYVLTPVVNTGIKKLIVEVNSKNDGTGTDEVTRTFDVFDGETAVLSNVAGSTLLAGVVIEGTHTQLKIAPNETGGGACYIKSITVEY